MLHIFQAAEHPIFLASKDVIQSTYSYIYISGEGVSILLIFVCGATTMAFYPQSGLPCRRTTVAPYPLQSRARWYEAKAIPKILGNNGCSQDSQTISSISALSRVAWFTQQRYIQPLCFMRWRGSIQNESDLAVRCC